MNPETVVLIIPTYNKAEAIEETIFELSNIQPTLQNKKLKVLIFDSASNDNTVQLVEHMQKRLDWLYLKQENQKTGLGSAYYQAMQFALNHLNADIVVEFDADLSHQPKYLLPMMQSIDKYDVVMGSRYVSEGKLPKNWALYRKIISYGGNLLTRVVLTSKYKDFTSGFRATRQTFLKKALEKPFISNHFAYKLDLLWRLHLLQAHIYELPIEFVDREKGKSKLPKNSILESLHVIFKLRYQYWLNYVAGFSGML